MLSECTTYSLWDFLFLADEKEGKAKRCWKFLSLLSSSHLAQFLQKLKFQQKYEGYPPKM